MKKLLATASVLALSLAVPAFAQENCGTTQATLSTLTISADADVKAAPDLTMISAGVVTTAPTADAALKENAQKMTAVFGALKKAGVAEKDMQTSGINVSPQYNYQENKSPTIIGYQASNNVNVALHDLKSIGPVLDTLVAQGANQINGPTFSIDEPETLLNKARQEAVAKARKRADIYAAAAGLKIKRIVSMSEQTGYSGPPMPYQMMAMKGREVADAASSPVASGEVNLTATVNIVYELGN
jgi:uncharacterized protein